MRGARALISENHKINNDAGTYIFYAKIAARNEASGSVTTAEALWLKAKRRAENDKDRKWADIRATICRNRYQKWDMFLNIFSKMELTK